MSEGEHKICEKGKENDFCKKGAVHKIGPALGRFCMINTEN